MQRISTKVWRYVRIQVMGTVGVLLLWLLFHSVRWKRHEQAVRKDEMWQPQQARIFCFWHGRQLMMPFLFRSDRKVKIPVYTLISQHSDGRIIARAVRWLGIRSVAGSSTRGGRRALQKLTKKVIEGNHLAITPDGPKGPLRKLKPGVVRIAQSSGATIYPCAYAAENVWEFSSWDKMILPKPFTRGVYYVGEGIQLGSGGKEELDDAGLQMVEDRLNAATDIVDEFSYA